MKKFAAVLTIVTLGGCAMGPVQFRPSDLRQAQYLRTERKIPLTFPKIQMALFKHKQVCGWAPEFTLDNLQTSYATVYYKPTPSSPDNRTIIVDLTYLEGGTVRAEAYSYYPDTATQIAEVFTAMIHPGVCPGQKIPEKEIPGQEGATGTGSKQ